MSFLNEVNTLKAFEYNSIVRHGIALQGSDIISGVFSTYGHSWVACGPNLFIINHSDGGIQSSWSFGENSTDVVEVTCAVELPFEKCTIPLLVVGVSSENINHVCFFNPNTRKIVRTISCDFPVRVVCIIEDGLNEVNPLNEALTCTEGLLAVGCADGSVLVVDLCRSQLLKVLNGDLCFSNNESNPVKLVWIPVDSVSPRLVKEKLEECCKTKSCFAVNISDCSDDGITALCYSVESAILYVGTSSGSFLLWNMTNLSCLFRSQSISRPVISLSMLEPCDDPRHNLYLWICYENHPQVVMYCISFSSKYFVQGYGVYYQGFESAGLVYRLVYGSDENFTSLKAVNSLSVAKPISQGSECMQLRLFVTSFEGILGEKLEMRAVLFDLNQWYKEQMPDDGFSSCVASIELGSGEGLWHLMIDASSLTHYQWVRPMEEHFHPTALDFRGWCLEAEGIRSIEKLGLQSLWLRNMSLVGPSALLHPQPLFQGALQAGLFPTYTEPPDPEFASTEDQRKYILTVCLENKIIRFIEHCAAEWSTGSHPVAGCTLAFLLDWLWELHGIYKSQGNKMCVPLFDQCGLQFDDCKRRSLQHCKSLLCTSQTLYTNIVKEYNNFVLLDSLDNKLSAMSLLRFYFDCCLKLISADLLPESNEAGMPMSSLSYKYEEISKFVSKRRREGPFLCDSLIGGKGGEDGWVEEGGTGKYPPPSIQSALRYCLHPVPTLGDKLSLIFYLYMDVVNSHWPIRGPCGMERVNNFQYLLRIPDIQCKIVSAFWYLDHNLFREGMDLLLDKRILPVDLSSDQHRCVLLVLSTQGQEKLALQYLRLKAVDLHHLEDLRLELDLLLRNRLINEAFMFQRKHLEFREELLFDFFSGCLKKELLGQVFGLHLDPKEESFLLKFLRSSDLENKGDLQVLFLLSRAKYTEATTLNDRLKKTVNGWKVRVESLTRDMIVRGVTGSINSISRDISKEAGILHKHGGGGTCLKPLSALVKVRNEPDGPLLQNDSKLLLNAAAKSARHLTDFINISDLRSRKRCHEESDTLLTDFENPPKKKPSWEAGSGIVGEINSIISSGFSGTPQKPFINREQREVMQLVGTPLVKKHGKRISPHSKPSSILKGKGGERVHTSVDHADTPSRKTLRFAGSHDDEPVTRRNLMSDVKTPDFEDKGDFIESIRDRLRSSKTKLLEGGGVDWKNVVENCKPKTLFTLGVSEKTLKKPKNISLESPVALPSVEVTPDESFKPEISILDNSLGIKLRSSERKYLASPSREGEPSPVTQAVFEALPVKFFPMSPSEGTIYKKSDEKEKISSEERPKSLSERVNPERYDLPESLSDSLPESAPESLSVDNDAKDISCTESINKEDVGERLKDNPVVPILKEDTITPSPCSEPLNTECEGDVGNMEVKTIDQTISVVESISQKEFDELQPSTTEFENIEDMDDYSEKSLSENTIKQESIIMNISSDSEGENEQDSLSSEKSVSSSEDCSLGSEASDYEAFDREVFGIPEQSVVNLNSDDSESESSGAENESDDSPNEVEALKTEIECTSESPFHCENSHDVAEGGKSSISTLHCVDEVKNVNKVTGDSLNKVPIEDFSDNGKNNENTEETYESSEKSDEGSDVILINSDYDENEIEADAGHDDRDEESPLIGYDHESVDDSDSDDRLTPDLLDTLVFNHAQSNIVPIKVASKYEKKCEKNLPDRNPSEERVIPQDSIEMRNVLENTSQILATTGNIDSSLSQEASHSDLPLVDFNSVIIKSNEVIPQVESQSLIIPPNPLEDNVLSDEKLMVDNSARNVANLLESQANLLISSESKNISDSKCLVSDFTSASEIINDKSAPLVGNPESEACEEAPEKEETINTAISSNSEVPPLVLAEQTNYIEDQESHISSSKSVSDRNVVEDTNVCCETPPSCASLQAEMLKAKKETSGIIGNDSPKNIILESLAFSFLSSGIPHSSSDKEPSSIQNSEPALVSKPFISDGFPDLNKSLNIELKSDQTVIQEACSKFVHKDDSIKLECLRETCRDDQKILISELVPTSSEEKNSFNDNIASSNENKATESILLCNSLKINPAETSEEDSSKIGNSFTEENMTVVSSEINIPSPLSTKTPKITERPLETIPTQEPLISLKLGNSTSPKVEIGTSPSNTTQSFFFGRDEKSETFLRRTEKVTYQVGSRVSVPCEDEPDNPMETAVIEQSGGDLPEEEESTDPRNIGMLDLTLQLSENEFQDSNPKMVDKSMITEDSYLLRKSRKASQNVDSANGAKHVKPLVEDVAEKPYWSSDLQGSSGESKLNFGTQTSNSYSIDRSTKGRASFLEQPSESIQKVYSDSQPGCPADDKEEDIKSIKPKDHLIKTRKDSVQGSSELKGILKNKNEPTPDSSKFSSGASLRTEVEESDRGVKNIESSESPEPVLINPSSKRSRRSSVSSRTSEGGKDVSRHSIKGILKKCERESINATEFQSATTATDFIPSKKHHKRSSERNISDSREDTKEGKKLSNVHSNESEVRGILKNKFEIEDRRSVSSETSLDMKKRLNKDFPEDKRRSRRYSEEPDVFGILKRTEGFQKKSRKSLQPELVYELEAEELVGHRKRNFARSEYSCKGSSDLEIKTKKSEAHGDDSSVDEGFIQVNDEPKLHSILKNSSDSNKSSQNQLEGRKSNRARRNSDTDSSHPKRSRRSSHQSADEEGQRQSSYSEGPVITGILKKPKKSRKDSLEVAANSEVFIEEEEPEEKILKRRRRRLSASSDASTDVTPEKRRRHSLRGSQLLDPVKETKHIKTVELIQSPESARCHILDVDSPEERKKSDLSGERRRSLRQRTPEKLKSETFKGSESKSLSSRKCDFPADVASTSRKSRSLQDFPIRKCPRLHPILEDIKEEDEDVLYKQKSFDDLDIPTSVRGRKSHRRKSGATPLDDNQFVDDKFTAESYVNERRLTRTQKNMLLKHGQILEGLSPRPDTPDSPEPGTSTPKKQRKKRTSSLADGSPITPTRSSLRLQKKPPSEKDLP